MASTSIPIRGKLYSGLLDVRFANILPPIVVTAAISVWFFAIGTPLWLDETVSYWQISGGFFKIWQRQGLSFPGYSYILWMTNALLGSSTFALRAPSIIAMLAATYVLYKIAREFFEKDVALLVVVVFCVYPTVIFAAIDARPYACGILVVNCAILSLVRWMRAHSTTYAVYFGIAAGGIFYFHYLFGTILIAFAVTLLIIRRKDLRSFAAEAKKALLAFFLVMLPVISRLVYLFKTSGSHVFSAPPNLYEIYPIFAPGYMLQFLALALLIGAVMRKVSTPQQEPAMAGFICLLLALVPIALLYGISAHSSIHVFVPRYQLAAVPGIALCWGLLLSRINSNSLRMLFCMAVLTLAAYRQYEQPTHEYSWKDALETANAQTAADHAPLLICSDLPEADHQPMPADLNSLNVGLFAPLSYYKVNSPVVPLPRALNQEAKSQVNKFLTAAVPAKKRFLVVAFLASRPTLDWIRERTKDSYHAREIGVYDGVSVVEYVSR